MQTESQLQTIPVQTADVDVISIAIDARDRYDAISTYSDKGIVDRYIRDYSSDELTAQEFFAELKKFLAISVAANAKGTSIGMAGPVDEMWHTALLFTRNYRELCGLAGGFVEHVPDVQDIDHVMSAAGYVRFLSIYESAFGVQAPLHIWPDLNSGVDGIQAAAAAACGGCGTGGPGSCSSCSGCQGQTLT